MYISKQTGTNTAPEQKGSPGKTTQKRTQHARNITRTHKPNTFSKPILPRPNGGLPRGMRVALQPAHARETLGSSYRHGFSFHTARANLHAFVGFSASSSRAGQVSFTGSGAHAVTHNNDSPRPYSPTPCLPKLTFNLSDPRQNSAFNWISRRLQNFSGAMLITANQLCFCGARPRRTGQQTAHAH